MEEKKPMPGIGPNGHGPHQSNTAHDSGSKQPLSGGSVNRHAIRDSQLYKRILGQSLKQAGLGLRNPEGSRHLSNSSNAPQGQFSPTPHLVPPKSSGGESNPPDNNSQRSVAIAGLSQEDNESLVRQVAEMAATAAAVAARDAVRAPRRTSVNAQTPARTPAHLHPSGTFREDNEEAIAVDALPHGVEGGHDAPNWSRKKSAIILLGATVLYAIIAEILVNTVDVVLESVDIDEKFLGITLFALVPNTTEFLVSLCIIRREQLLTLRNQNAISFAMNGNIALSMEIGSAYALQVCLLQIPALVLFSAVHGRFVDPQDLLNHTFK